MSGSATRALFLQLLWMREHGIGRLTGLALQTVWHASNSLTRGSSTLHALLQLV